MGRNKHKKLFIKDIIIIIYISQVVMVLNIFVTEIYMSHNKKFTSAKTIYMYVSFHLWYMGIFIELFKSL